MRSRALLLLTLALAASGVSSRVRARARQAPPPLACADVVSVGGEGGERLGCTTDPALAGCDGVVAGERYAGCERQGPLPGQVLLPRGLPLNANTASASDFEALPGIGPGLAKRITDVREEASFADSEDLQRVPGIGERRAEAMAPHLTFGE